MNANLLRRTRSKTLPKKRIVATGIRDEEMRTRILGIARAQYTRMGFSAVTVEETAAAAGISKKTLYQHFPSKDELLNAVTRAHVENVHAALRAIYRDTARSPLQRLRGMMDLLAEVYGEMSGAMVHDLQRCAPECWREVEANRQQHIEEDFSALMRDGQSKGAFRKDVDMRVFLLIYATVARQVLNPETFMDLKIPPASIFDAVSKVLFEGILTDKARKEYHETP